MTSHDEKEGAAMTVRSFVPLVLFLISGCVPAPRPNPASEPEDGAVWAVVEALESPDPVRRALARSLLEEIGPAGAPVLRRLLTRGSEPADPSLQELVASLDAPESPFADTAQDQILSQGRRAAPVLWEALLTTASTALALRAVVILERLEGPTRVRSVVETLWSWGWAPRWLDPGPDVPPAAARLAAVREAEGEPTLARRSRKLTDNATLREFVADIDEASRLLPVVFVEQVERIEK